MTQLEWEHLESSDWYFAHQHLLPALREEGLKIVQIAGKVEITDFPTKAVRLNVGAIINGLSEQQGQAILESIQLQPWPRVGRQTISLLWQFAFRNLRAWMSTQLGEPVNRLWLGKKHASSNPISVQAGGMELEYELVGTGWD